MITKGPGESDEDFQDRRYAYLMRTRPLRSARDWSLAILGCHWSIRKVIICEDRPYKVTIVVRGIFGFRPTKEAIKRARRLADDNRPIGLMVEVQS